MHDLETSLKVAVDDAVIGSRGRGDRRGGIEDRKDSHRLRDQVLIIRVTEVCKMASSSYYSWAAMADKWGWASSGWRARELEKGSCSGAWHPAGVTHGR